MIAHDDIEHWSNRHQCHLPNFVKFCIVVKHFTRIYHFHGLKGTYKGATLYKMRERIAYQWTQAKQPVGVSIV